MRFGLQGHRGARGLKPENTLPAFAHALAIGVDALELDVGVSADGVVVVTHDRCLNPLLFRDRHGRWLEGEGPPIACLTYDELLAYDVGRIRPDSDYAREFPRQEGMDDTCVPRLDDVIEMVRRAKNETVQLNVEAKVSAENRGETIEPETFAEALVATVRAHDFGHRTIIQSFEWRVPIRVQSLAPEIRTAYLTSQQSWLDNVRADSPRGSQWTGGWRVASHRGSIPATIKAAGGWAWSSYFREVDRTSIGEARALGLKVLVWTVNEVADMRSMIELGVDGIISDYPDRLREVARSMSWPLPEPTPVATYPDASQMRRVERAREVSRSSRGS